jgi:nucleotide-binding universal stress UspA family protein
MLPLHTVLFPTDFSETARQAFPVACSLTRDCGARLVALYVMPPLSGAERLRAQQHPREYYGEALASLHELRAPEGDVRVEYQLREGEPTEEILDVAQQISAGLIVMGTQGKTGLERVLVGSVAEEVMRNAPCPVLTVRAPRPELMADRPRLAKAT